MIANVTQYGSLLILRDQKGQQVGSLSISGGEFIGHSSDFIMVKYGNVIITVDENQRQLGSIPFDSEYIIGGITDSGFTARTGSMVFVYDKYCRKINAYGV